MRQNILFALYALMYIICISSITYYTRQNILFICFARSCMVKISSLNNFWLKKKPFSKYGYGNT